MRTRSFAAFAAGAAFIAGVSGFLYAVSFIVLKSAALSAVFLLLGGIASIIVWTGLYEHFRDFRQPFPLLALLLSLAAALGSIVHGGYDLSNALHPPAALNADLPNPVDPRGLLTFGIAALGLYFFTRLASADKGFPRGLVYLGFASAALMAILYLGRLIILQAASPLIAIPALIEGFLLNPVWLIWLGLEFRHMN